LVECYISRNSHIACGFLLNCCIIAYVKRYTAASAVNAVLMASQWKRCLQLINVKRKCWCQSGLRSRSLIPNNTASWSRICLSDSGCPIGSFFTSHSLNGYSCGDGTISFETFVEREISCCAP